VSILGLMFMALGSKVQAVLTLDTLSELYKCSTTEQHHVRESSPCLRELQFCVPLACLSYLV
jgi:hypothetical protein